MSAIRWTRRAGVIAVVSLLATGCASWNSMSRTEKGTAIGAGTGAVAGAAVGGPVGAAVGAGVGGIVGHEAEAPGGRSTAAGYAPDPSLVRSAQQSLNDRGYAVGAVDGQWGPSTQNALREFQRAQGLPTTGVLDDRTLAALGVASAGSNAAGNGGTTRTAPVR